MARVATVFAFSLAAVAAAPAFAQDPERPFTEREISAADVATTPLSDLNLRKAEIPALLISAQEKPYDMDGLKSCSRIASAVGELDAVLGEDLDMPRAASRNMPSAGALGQWAIGSFIPFRGALREISGANAQERRIQAAIQAGQSRRAFLKGAGQARGCAYPANSAPPELVAERIAEHQAAAQSKQRKGRNAAKQSRGGQRIAEATTAR